MKSTIVIFSVTSLITFFASMGKNTSHDSSEEMIRKWADSLEFAYKHEPTYACMTAELERRISSSEIQLRRIQGVLPVHRHFKVWRIPGDGAIFFTSAQ